MTARFDVTVRGQSKTQGHFSREVPFEAGRLRLFQSDEGRDRLACLSKQMIENARTLQNLVLRKSLTTLNGT